MTHLPVVDTTLRFHRRLLAAVGIAVILTGLLFFLSWRMVQLRAEDADGSAHTVKVFTELELARRHLADARRGARDYALSGSEASLEAYESGNRAVIANLEALQTLTANPNQERRLNVLSEQVRSNLGAAAGLVATRQRLAVAPSLAQLGAEMPGTEDARTSIQEMEAGEKMLLEQHTQHARGTLRFITTLLWGNAALELVFLPFAALVVIREMRVATIAQAQDRAVNATLRRSVEQRTAALSTESAAHQDAETKLRHSEHMYRMLLDGISDYAVYMLDVEGCVASWNAGAARITGYHAREVIGKHVRCFYTATDHAQKRPEAALQEAVSAGSSEGEGWRLRKDQSSFWANAVISPIYDESGALSGYSNVMRDITAQKQAQEVRERLASVVDSSDDAIISSTLDGTIVAWNRGAEELFGYSASEAVGSPLLLVIPADRLDEESDIVARTMRGVSIKHFETVRVHRDGMRIDVSLAIAPMRDRDGVIIGASKIARDISERIQAENKLSAQAAELARSRQAVEAQKLMMQSVLNSMVEGLVAVDEQGNLILSNPAANKILGLGPSDVFPGDWNLHYGALLPDMVTAFPNHRNPLQRAILGEISTEEIFLGEGGNDKAAWIESNGAPLRDKDGMACGGVIAFRDISQRKTDELAIRAFHEVLEDRIAQRTKELETANKEMEAFSYSVSHDLRAPLRHIGGFSRILLSDFGPEMPVEARGHLQRIEDAVIRMGLLVDGLLSLAMLGRQSLQLRHTELDVIVERVILLLQPDCEGRNVEWRIAPLPTLQCDRILVEQVFQNLLGNALKYSRDRSPSLIEVGRIQQPGKPEILFVRDNGAGFDMKYAEKLFGVFQRMHTTAEFEGTGVGLAIVQRIIQKHGGNVWAEAEPGRGATFCFTLG